MSGEPLVSIITPSYNASKYIRETIQSVKSQSYSNFEMLIADDCSSDGTRAIVQEEMEWDTRVRLIQLKENGGPAAARNEAMKLAKGEYLAFLDSDDLWHPNKLERQLAFMKERELAFTFTNYRMMNEEGQMTGSSVTVPLKTTYQDLLKNTMIGTLTVMINKKKILGKVQMELHRDCSEDYGLWLSILANGIDAYGLREELAYYRRCENSLSSNKLNSALKTWNTYRKIRGIGRVSAAWYFINYSVNALKKHRKAF